MRELGRPSHFAGFVHEGNLVLFPAALATFDEQAKGAGVPASVLRRAYAMAARQRPRAAGGTEDAASGVDGIPIT